MLSPLSTCTDCTACPRLADFLAEIRTRHPEYHARPVAPFGDPSARLLIVGLAPGMHGANRTGRPFTGDYAGIMLYATLYRHGFASTPESLAADLELYDCRISNAVKCLPPQNKPEPSEIRTCNRFLADELRHSPELKIIVALGVVAHKAVLMALRLRAAEFPFGHGARHELPRAVDDSLRQGARLLIDSYHCSRYNTQTRRLSAEHFSDIFSLARAELDRPFV
jgi:uracil-DNA glycosylase family 4